MMRSHLEVGETVRELLLSRVSEIVRKSRGRPAGRGMYLHLGLHSLATQIPA
jgi:hypothetical protein